MPEPASPAKRLLLSPGAVLALVLAGAFPWAAGPVALAQAEAPPTQGDTQAQRPALSVTLTAPEPADWPRTVTAYGNVVAQQEALIGPELSGYRLTKVLVDVGDRVTKGQLLARVADEVVAAELAQSRAAVEEAEARLVEARADADRARTRRVEESGALSAQQINQFLAGEQSAQARLSAARAKVQADELRLSQTRILAPEDGVISARTATVGSLAQPGSELFRMILGGRLEWRAQVTALELAQVAPGMAAALVPPRSVPSAASGDDPAERVEGRVRMVAPTLDPQTRYALVYVDLPADSPLRAGMFVRGELAIGQARALTLPQSAVVLREGFAYVFQVGGDGRVGEVKVELGRRVGDRVEITRGVTAEMRLVATGAGFLADGDLVRVVDAPPPPKGLAAFE
jgi:RND family efflux transporter MFP subunit